MPRERADRHLQLPQGKLVRVVQGAIFDVAVDLRRSSPSFGRWTGVTLQGDEGQLLWIPPGFAHGFLSLSDLAEIIYPSSKPYSASHEGALNWADPNVAIEWPFAPTVVSKKDASALMLAEIDPLEIQP